MIKSKYILHAADKAGFVLWENNIHNNNEDSIDWGSSYDNELTKFARILSMDICDIVHEFVRNDCDAKTADLLVSYIENSIDMKETKL